MFSSSFIIGISYAVLGVNIFVILLALSNRHKTHIQYLLLLCFAHLMTVIYDIYEISYWWQSAPHLYNFYLPFTYLIAPSIFLYIHSLIHSQCSPGFKLKSPHWLGFVVVMILCVPYFSLNSTIKLNRLMAEAGTLEHLGMITVGPFLAILLLIPFSVYYLAKTLKLINDNMLNIKAFFSDIRNKNLSGIRLTIIVFMLTLIITALQLFLPDSLTDLKMWQIMYSLFGYASFTVFSLLSIQQKPIVIDHLGLATIKESDLSSNTYQKSQLSQSEIIEIKKKLLDSMSVSRLYLVPGLTLRQLADEINVSQNKISQVLNNFIHEGFYDFINRRRIEDAKNKIIEGNQSILEIAYAVGFNSKSAFNTAFKKYNGLTPSQFKKDPNQSKLNKS